MSLLPESSLPFFKYHPDPMSSGSVKRSDARCLCCERERGYIYTGPAYSEAELDEALCPWCIASGEAAAKFQAEFTDPEGIGDRGTWGTASPEVVSEVSLRTPGFAGWQQERWWTCCGDAAAFLGPAGRKDLEARWPEVIPALQSECGLEGEEWDEYYSALDRNHGPTAYVFRCLKCEKLGGYSDCH